MKHCIFCNAEMPKGSTVCPCCGKDNAKRSPSAAVIAAAVVAVFLIVCVVLTIGDSGVNHTASIIQSVKAAEASEEVTEAAAEEVTEAAEDAAEEAATDAAEEASENDAEATAGEATEETEEETASDEPTVPADGDPDDVTCKGTYTAEDAAVIAAHDQVVATAGEYELTLGQLQVYYWMQYRSFMSTYGAYVSYFGLDTSQSLDTQICPLDSVEITWQQFFLASAINSWLSYRSIAAEADANGYELTEDQLDDIENAAEKLEETALANGYESGEDMLHSSLGAGAEVEDYVYFMELYYKANNYYNDLADSVAPTDEELEAYFDEYADEYSESGITKDTIAVDVRHILIFPEGADSSTVYTEEFSDEAWAYAETTAHAILDEFLAGDQSEDSFAALANEYSEDSGSNTNGGLYEDVTEGEMVDAFNDWCFDESRQAGDTGIVKTEYGYHVMYFSGSSLLWKEYALSDYVTEKASALAQEIVDKYTLTISYSDILLADADTE